MKFGSVPTETAVGAILAHSLRVERGRISKGSLLSETDAEALRQAGYESVTVARLEPGDVGEDAAAERLAERLTDRNIRHGRPGTGRCNLHATERGLLVIDEDAVAGVNAVDEAITLATLRPYAVIEARQLVATVKIINFAVPEARLAEVEAMLEKAGPVLRIAPFRPLRAGLIQTTVEGSKPSLIGKAVDITKGRLARIGASLERTATCPHEIQAIRGAVADMAGSVDLLLLIGASAIMDRRDVIPSALVAAGGSIERLGMPVDPGNLTLVGSLGEVAVVAMPGSARSPRLHGTDWILERIAAGVEVSDADVAAMGVGGLLLEIPSRPAPRDQDSRRKEPGVAAIVLAAGRSSRMGGANKLLEPIDGAPMIRRTVEQVLASRASPVTVVTGRDAPQIGAALDGLPVTIVHNPDFATGMSTSLKAGIESLSPDVDAAVICLGDMPALDPATIDAMIEIFAYEENGEIVVPTRDGRRGNPVLWSRRFFPEMAAVSGDRGARTLLTRYASVIAEAEVDDPGILLDLDTPAALDAFRRGDGGGQG